MVTGNIKNVFQLLGSSLRLKLILALSRQGNVSLVYVTNFKKDWNAKKLELHLTEFPMHINETSKLSTRWCCRNLLESFEILILTHASEPRTWRKTNQRIP